MFAGIEIGGTKLQVGIGDGRGEPLVVLRRTTVEPERGAEWIRAHLVELLAPLLGEYPVEGIGVGFGGPIDQQAGRTITSHQVCGWDDFPLQQWCEDTFRVPAVLANDSDSAGVAEARFGAGRGQPVVFYTNVGSGIGGALVIEGRLHGGSGGVASEIGHLRPGPDAESADQTVESLASGWAIARWVRQQIEQPDDAPSDLAAATTAGQPASQADRDDLLCRCGGQIDLLDTRTIAQAAQHGNRLALEAFGRACRVFGWAVAQVVTLIAPNVVVIGGGVSLVGERLWLQPLREHVRRYVFPPLADQLQVVPAALGEEVVVHGVLALARERFATPGTS